MRKKTVLVIRSVVVIGIVGASLLIGTGSSPLVAAESGAKVHFVPGESLASPFELPVNPNDESRADIYNRPGRTTAAYVWNVGPDTLEVQLGTTPTSTIAAGGNAGVVESDKIILRVPAGKHTSGFYIIVNP
jgi:hypothetical protein